MNSILQTLFMTPEFRRNIYAWNYEENMFWEEKDCIPYQLQRLFAKLQLKESSAVGTHMLTKSFQWDYNEAFQQHDIQEFCRVLFDVVSETFKGSDAEGFIESIFEGENSNFVKCLECQKESTRFEKWLDLQITVRDEFENVYNDKLEKGLENYLKPERLEKDNKFFCENCNQKNNVSGYEGIDKKKYVDIPIYIEPKDKAVKFKRENSKSSNEASKKPKIAANKGPSSQTKEFLKQMREKKSGKETKEEEETKENDSNLSKKNEEVNSDTNSIGKNKEFRIVSNSPNKSHDLNVEVDGDEEKKNEFQCPLSKFDYEKDRNKSVELAFLDGENVYDLYSVLVHSGGAFGGHYFAYIKSFENGKWYIFNDGSVNEVDPLTIPSKTFGGTAATSAYMLFYRKIDKEAFEKGNEYRSSELPIPNYLLSKLESDKAIELAKAEEEKRNKKITVRVYFQLEVKHISISPYSTYSDLLLQALKEYNMMNELGNVRLRAYAPHTDIMLDDYEGKEEMQLVDLEITSFKTLCIEMKMPNEEFLPYVQDTVYFRWVSWDDKAMIDNEEERKLSKIQVHKDTPMRELMEKLAECCNLKCEDCKFMKKVESNTMAIIDLKNYSEFPVLEALIHEGAIIYVEKSDDDPKPKWERYFEEKYFMFAIKFNNPNEEDPYATQEIIFDGRRKLRELKLQLCETVNIPPHRVVMKRGGKNGIDVKDLSPTLESLSYSSGSNIFLEKGMPCGPGEFRILFHKAIKVHDDPNNLHQYEFLFELPIHGLMKPSEILPKVLQEAQSLQIPLEGNWRLREKLSDRLGRLYKEASLKTQGIFDKRSIALEEVSPQMIGDKAGKYNERDLLINVRIWDQSNWKLLPWFEIIVDKFKKLNEIPEKILEVEKSIPSENMQVCLILSLKNFKPFQLDKEEWRDIHNSNDMIANFPFYLTNDGYLLIIKDSRITPRELTEEEKILNSKEFVRERSYVLHPPKSYTNSETDMKKPSAKEKGVSIKVKRKTDYEETKLNAKESENENEDDDAQAYPFYVSRMM